MRYCYMHTVVASVDDAAETPTCFRPIMQPKPKVGRSLLTPTLDKCADMASGQSIYAIIGLRCHR